MSNLLRNNEKTQNSQDSSTKVSERHVTVEDNENNYKLDFLSPKMINNCSLEIEPTKVLSNNVEEPNRK